MELGHSSARSGLTNPEVSSKVFLDSFRQLEPNRCFIQYFDIRDNFFRPYLITNIEIILVKIFL